MTGTFRRLWVVCYPPPVFTSRLSVHITQRCPYKGQTDRVTEKERQTGRQTARERGTGRDKDRQEESGREEKRQKKTVGASKDEDG